MTFKLNWSEKCVYLCWSEAFSKVLCKNLWTIDLVFPPLIVCLTNDFRQHSIYEEDTKALKGHHDGVNVGQRGNLFNFHNQKTKDPCQSHDHNQRNSRPEPTAHIVDLWVICLLLLMPPHYHPGHDEEANVDQQDEDDWSNEGPHKVRVWSQKAAVNYLINIKQ